MDFGWWGQIYFLMRWMRYSDSNKKCLIWVLEFSQICHNGLTKSDLMKNVLTLIAKLPSQQHFLRKVKVDFISAKVAFQEAQIAFLGKFFFSPSFCCFFSGFLEKYCLVRKLKCLFGHDFAKLAAILRESWDWDEDLVIASMIAHYMTYAELPQSETKRMKTLLISGYFKIGL